MAKAAATALLAATSKPWLLCYFIADHVVHLLYRVWRRDLVNFTPMPVAASYIAGVIVRGIQKVIIDFTGSLLWRLPLLNGGTYWFFNLVASQTSVFVCVHLYLKHAPRPGVNVDKIEADTLWAGATGLAVAWLLTFTFFVFRVAVPKYRHTLWSWTSGRQCVQDYFHEGQGDEAKFNVFGCNLLLWESDIGDEVRAWTAENWARWKEEKPAWFKIEVVPDQFVPAAELEQLGYNWTGRGCAVGSIRDRFGEGGGGVGEEEV
jgi:hypothetical protein